MAQSVPEPRKCTPSWARSVIFDLLVADCRWAYNGSAHLGRCIHERGTRSAYDRGDICIALARPRLLGFAVLVFIHGVRWAESVSVGAQRLVPNDVHFAEVRDEVSVDKGTPERRPLMRTSRKGSETMSIPSVENGG